MLLLAAAAVLIYMPCLMPTPLRAMPTPLDADTLLIRCAATDDVADATAMPLC